ncbi:MAG: exodeoxyribonuclease VII small subunit [Candidatus Kapabacteria bacterium]|nr:exodeoxyribonuclease VII small subunit [Ignavibacteriota bacterium]MCW5883462.1 exodeoxyribonuclease VII small subunit [Candidatus Kapabacteria bacterium]
MKNSKDFEGKIRRIEEIIDALDEGEVPIEEMLKIYEEGMKLTSECKDFLSKAELKIIDISKVNNAQSE